MAGEVRSRMVAGAVRLLATRGLQGTSFSEVLELTGAPRGSVYHHFPGGKDELVAAAVDLSAEQAVALLEQERGATAEEVAGFFLEVWRRILTGSGFEAGCALLAVTVATDSPDLRARTSAAFSAWRSALADLLAEGGVPPEAAPALATTLLAASEGAVVLSRASHDLGPFDEVADQLLAQVRAATG